MAKKRSTSERPATHTGTTPGAAQPSIPAEAALSFLKDTKGALTWSVRDLADTLKISGREAKRAIALLAAQGYLQRASRTDEWMTTPAGESVSGAKPPRFYTEIIGFAKKTDFSQGPYRWLTVASPEEPEGTEQQLALNNNPAAEVYPQAMFQQRQPAAMFSTDDIKGDYERIKACGAEFTMPPTDVTGQALRC
jgi:hypothetical protein